MDESSHGPEDLRAVHQRRLAERNGSLERWTKLDRRVTAGRLALFCVCLVVAALSATAQ
ncbi:MAG: hypothetical protein ACHRXM_26275 [Isosphaerales bacterium]